MPSAQNPSHRNLLRNLSNYTINKMFPGAQRNTTMRDSKAFAEDASYGQSINYDSINSNLMGGVSSAGI